MGRKSSAKKPVQEEPSRLEKQRAKKWDKGDENHYKKMKTVTIKPTQLACPETMARLGIQADIEGLFQNMGLGQLWSLNELTYPDLVRQFLASAYVTHPDDDDDDDQEGFLAFVVEKKYYELKFTDICGLFGLSAGGITTGLYWTSELAEFWQVIGTGMYGARNAKESLVRNPVLRYATRLIGSLFYGTTTSASVTALELNFLFQGVRHLLPAFRRSSYPTSSHFNMGAMIAANLAEYKGKVTKTKTSVCGFGAVVTRILRHVGVNLNNHPPVMDASNNVVWNYLGMQSLISKEFIAGPFSRIPSNGPYVYVFQDRERRGLYCDLPQPHLVALLSASAVEFLPPHVTLTNKPSYFIPKYQTKGKAVEVEVEEEEEEREQGEASRADTGDDSQPYQLLPMDSSQYRLPELEPNATPRQQQQWRDQSIKTNNDMLHRIWAAIARIRPCRCHKDDVLPRDHSPSTSGSSGTRRQRKKSKGNEDTGTSRAADE